MISKGISGPLVSWFGARVVMSGRDEANFVIGDPYCSRFLLLD